MKEWSGELDTEIPKTTSPEAPLDKNTMAISAVVILMEIQPKNGEKVERKIEQKE